MVSVLEAEMHKKQYRMVELLELLDKDRNGHLHAHQ